MSNAQQVLDTSKARQATRETPVALGYRMPAEWEPHEATWIGWPHNKTDWPGKFAPIPWVYAEIVRRPAPGETVRILATRTVENNRAHSGRARIKRRPDALRGAVGGAFH